MNVLVTGGLGFIGSHTCVSLLDAGHKVAIIDNLNNTSINVLQRLTQITHKKPTFYQGDICNSTFLKQVFMDFKPHSVMHFAGLKSVSESLNEPYKYYDNNVSGTLSLLETMIASNVKTLIFSSTANIYGNANVMPVSETTPAIPNNPYGRSKHMIEEVLRDLSVNDPAWQIACLRYFNPVGAHPSGLIGENPRNIPNNLMPLLMQTAHGLRDKFYIFGQDYPTPDGTPVRDFIHVVDLAESHLATLNYLSGLEKAKHQFLLANVGTGKGISVLELVLAFELHTGITIPYEFKPPRNGDIAISCADVSLAEQTLGWKARLGIASICKDAWRWQSRKAESHESLTT